MWLGSFLISVLFFLDCDANHDESTLPFLLMALLYIDTNVIIDAVKGRTNRSGIPIGDYASDLFFEAASCHFRLVISSWTLDEVKKVVSLEDIRFCFAWLRHKITFFEEIEHDHLEARNRDSSNFSDALHVVLAERSNAKYLVTRNTRDFLKIDSRVKVVRPEELL